MIDFVKQVPTWTVPPAFLGPDAEKWTTLDYRISISAIEHLLAKSDGNLSFSMGNLPLVLQQQKFTHMEITAAWGETSSSQVKNILETVRNRVLKFALDLGKEYPDAGRVKGPESKKAKMTEKVDRIFVKNIYGSANIGGTADNWQVVVNVMQGNLTSLETTLEKHGISPADIRALRSALEAEPKPREGGGFGPKVAAWIGRMAAKAAEGTWKVATGAATDLITKALAKYYGLD
jgi:hypothetical protein